MQEGSRYSPSLEERVRAMEKAMVRSDTRYDGIAAATKENTDAVKSLTFALEKVVNTLSYNKGAFYIAFKFASGGAIIASGIVAIGMWLYNITHGIKG